MYTIMAPYCGPNLTLDTLALNNRNNTMTTTNDNDTRSSSNVSDILGLRYLQLNTNNPLPHSNNTNITTPITPGTAFTDSLLSLRPIGEERKTTMDIFEHMDHFSGESSQGSSIASERLCASSPAPSTANNLVKAKTVLCKYYLAGDCSRGDGCSFAHGSKDLREISYSEAGSAVDESNDYVNEDGHSVSGVVEGGPNPNRKTKLCRNLFQDGMCPFDFNCNFAHSLAELKRTPGHIKGSSSSNHTNQTATKKVLSLPVKKIEPTDNKPVSHTTDARLYKTRVCKHFYKTGRCWLQNDCRFAHGKEELRGEEAAKAAELAKFKALL